jgi:hypothetical protein
VRFFLFANSDTPPTFARGLTLHVEVVKGGIHYWQHVISPETASRLNWHTFWREVGYAVMRLESYVSGRPRNWIERPRPKARYQIVAGSNDCTLVVDTWRRAEFGDGDYPIVRCALRDAQFVADALNSTEVR